MLSVFLTHGFRSSCKAMNNFKTSSCKHNVKIYAHEWNAGKQYGGNVEVIINTINSLLFFQPENTAEEWGFASDNVFASSEILAKNINMLTPQGGSVLLVAHSLGSEVVENALSSIREDILIYLFFMGGVSNALVIESLIELNEKIRFVINFYSERDFILNKFLPSVGSIYFDPIGSNSIESEKTLNIKLNIDHTGYCDNEKVFFYYHEIISKILENEI